MDLLKKTVAKNPNLVKVAASLHRSGEIPPDTYVIDLDTVRVNADKIVAEAKRVGLESYICAKQFGRNPLVIKTIMNSGMREAMAMDMEGVKCLHRDGVPIAHVGHYGQIPTSHLKYILNTIRPKVITVFSIEKAKQISQVASQLGIKQNLLVKVVEDIRLEALPTGGGYSEDEAIAAVKQINQLKDVRVSGLTSYPAFYFSLINKTHGISANFKTMMRTAKRIETELGVKMEHINAPGRNCVVTMQAAAETGATHVEPGHSFLGTLPNMAFDDGSPELPAVVYVTEISHFFADHALAYGDSYMATAVIGSLKNDIMYEYVFACVGDDPDSLPTKPLIPARPQEFWHSDLGWSMYCSLIPSAESQVKVGDTAVLGFRPQLYRLPKGRVAIVGGIQKNRPKLLGIFDRAGIQFEGEDEVPLGYDRIRVRQTIDSVA